MVVSYDKLTCFSQARLSVFCHEFNFEMMLLAGKLQYRLTAFCLCRKTRNQTNEGFSLRTVRWFGEQQANVSGTVPTPAAVCCRRSVTLRGSRVISVPVLRARLRATLFRFGRREQTGNLAESRDDFSLEL